MPLLVSSTPTGSKWYGHVDWEPQQTRTERAVEAIHSSGQTLPQQGQVHSTSPPPPALTIVRTWSVIVDSRLLESNVTDTNSLNSTAPLPASLGPPEPSFRSRDAGFCCVLAAAAAAAVPAVVGGCDVAGTVAASTTKYVAKPTGGSVASNTRLYGWPPWPASPHKWRSHYLVRQHMPRSKTRVSAESTASSQHSGDVYNNTARRLVTPHILMS